VTHLAGAWRDECEGNKSNPPVKGDFHRRIYFGRKDQSQVSTSAKPIVSRLRLWPHSPTKPHDDFHCASAKNHLAFRSARKAGGMGVHFFKTDLLKLVCSAGTN
jgi:hypothetical protein